MAEQAQLEAVFQFERDTPNTRRYKEVVKPGSWPIIKTLYVQKPAAEALGGGQMAETVRVTIEAG